MVRGVGVDGPLKSGATVELAAASIEEFARIKS